MAWSAVGNLVYALARWGMVVVLAQLGDAEDVGRLALGLAIGTPVFLLADLNLRSAQASDAAEDFAFGEYLALRLLTIPPAVATVAAIVAGTGISGETAAVVLLVAAALAVESGSRVFYGLYQQAERLDLGASSLVVRSVAGLTAFGVTFWTVESLPWSVVALAGAWLAAIVAHDLAGAVAALRTQGGPGRGAVRPRWQAGRLLTLARVALPLGLATGLWSLTANLPRYLIEIELGAAALGVFAAVAYAIRAVQVLATAIREAVIPRLAAYHVEGSRDHFVALVGRLNVVAIAIGAAGVAAAAAVGEPILRFAYGAEYARGGLLVVVMVAAAAMLLFAIPGVSAIVAMRRFGVLLGAHAVVAAVALAAGIWLVPAHGLVGAAWTLAVTFAAGSALNAVLVSRLVGTEARRSGPG